MSQLKTRLSVCPIANAARLLGDRWTLVILRDLVEGPKRFSELENTSEGISPRTLADRLRQMEGQGLVFRSPSARFHHECSTA
jgi:DNA-binding HxlR family transcriptional regulator